MKNRKIFGVFFREKPAMMLVNLLHANTEMYASNLAKSVDCTYSHIVKILREMQKASIVTFRKEGRLKILTLTKKGEDLAKAIDQASNLL